ncbi:hypothetical protein HPP92_015153 [Vanilla planifolia]|uniref:Pentatricopeptide repeat-containing protein n=1 Tax=Vanilla planifolia TaxID=51239 RepID=A0A835QLS1_VANPL|nr:hypothetical protein HPP92_015153 [Vanilla planifolia]
MNGPCRAAVSFTARECIALLRSYSRCRSLSSGKQLHAILISSGRLCHHPFLVSTLASMYSLCGNICDACQLFDRIPHKTPYLFNAFIRGSVDAGYPQVALCVFIQFLSSNLRPNNFTFPFVLKACGCLSLLPTGAQVHCRAMVAGFSSDEYVQNCLIAMYMSCQSPDAAEIVFREMDCKSAVSWNTMIAGCLQNGFADNAMAVFHRMVKSGMAIDQVTLLSVLPACAQLNDLECGRRVHNLAKENGSVFSLPVRNALIDMYARCGSLVEARKIFEEATPVRDVVCWTAMISGYVLNGRAVEALRLSPELQRSGIRPNSMTLSSLLTACGSLPSLVHGMCIHCLSVRFGLETDAFVETALIDMYSKCEDMDTSLQVFNTGSRRTATWNAIISGFARNGLAQHATEHFKQMLRGEVLPDLITITSLLPSYCSAFLKQASDIHGYLLKAGFHENIHVTTCLIDVYAKIGSLDTARRLFDQLPCKDFVSWSAIIAGYGSHGHAEEAIWLFDKMVESGVRPSEVTFTSVLYSCSHAGLVEEGIQTLEKMMLHCLKPKVDHYACVVDLLSRAGRIEEAYKLMMEMPYEANYAMWGALLGACMLHGKVKLGELAAEKLFNLQPQNTGNYVLLGNIYAAAERWVDAEAIRRMLGDRGLKKDVGCSSVNALNL